MKYKVTITKTDAVSVEIDAQSAEEAEEKAGIMFCDGGVELDPCFWPDGVEYHAEAIEND